MNRINSALAALLIIFMTDSALAARSAISGEFTDNEPSGPPAVEHPFCEENGPWPYQVIGPLAVDAPGEYTILDIGQTTSTTDTFLAIYAGMPNVDDLAENLVATSDETALVSLEPGTEYYVYVQRWCGIAFYGDIWAQEFDGPGQLTGPQTSALPTFTGGEWTEDDEIAEFIEPPPELSGDGFIDLGLEDCPRTYTDITGPVRFDRSGEYWFATAGSLIVGRPVWVNIYEGDFDPEAPTANRVGIAFNEPDGGFLANQQAFILKRDTDYTFVAQPYCDIFEGSWSFTVFPSKPFELNNYMANAYFDPATAGQGVLLDIDADAGFMFGAWFTWDTTPPAADEEEEEIGSPNQRWFTLTGNFEPGAGAVDLQIYNNTGGRFDDPAPVSETVVGTARLEMEDCEYGVMSFQFDSGERGDLRMIRGLPNSLFQCYVWANPGIDVLYR